MQYNLQLSLLTFNSSKKKILKQLIIVLIKYDNEIMNHEME